MTITSVTAHLLDCAAKYANRAAHPVVAWDCMGAATWAERCKELAAAVGGLDDSAALAYLKACRDGAPAQAASVGYQRPLSFIVGLDLVREMDKIIDPIAKEKRGWISVSSHGGLDDGVMSTRPGYRRMLQTNHCVGFCGRERGETDDAWLARRRDWLSQYHPDVLVTCTDSGYGWGLDGGQCTSVLGTVSQFAEVAHLDLRPGICSACEQPTADRMTTPGVRSYSTECGPMCGICHRERVPHRHPQSELEPA